MAFWKHLCSRQNRCAVSADCAGLSAAPDSARQFPKRSARRPAFAVCRKKLCAALLFAAALPLLAGCVPSEFTAVKPHSTAQAAATDADIPVVSDYIGMRRAIRNFAENGVKHGIIRTANYSGNVEEDLSRAAYAVARDDPIGSYAIDFLTHDCSLIVSYYEISIDITFREMSENPKTLEYVTNPNEVESLLRDAMDAYRDHVTWYSINDRTFDYAALAQQIYENDPLHYMALPQIHVTNYPDEGRSRIVELLLTYPADAATLKKMESAVAESLQAASVYVRYRDTEWEKADLLFTYLLERFPYTEQETDTPLYSALCEGLITSESAATAWKLLCDQIGIESSVVTGNRDGSTYYWNIVTLDGTSYHVDLLQSLLTDGRLRLRYDDDMIGYSWDAAAYPACERPETEQTTELDDGTLTDDRQEPEQTENAVEEVNEAQDEEIDMNLE